MKNKKRIPSISLILKEALTFQNVFPYTTWILCAFLILLIVYLCTSEGIETIQYIINYLVRW